MKIELTPQQAKAKNDYKNFVEREIRPYAAQFDKEECITTDIINKLAQQGYLNIIPAMEPYKNEIDMITIGILNEEIGRACSSVRSLLTVHGMVLMAVAKWGTREQKEYWLPRLTSGKSIGAFALTEQSIGSDAKSIETTATIEGKQYVLNGIKKWITFGQLADLFLVFARCDDKPTGFLVEREKPGLSVKPITGMMGLRGAMLSQLHFDGCRIPSRNLLGQVGFGLSHVALSSLDYGRYTIAWGCVGIGQACLDECICYTRKRKQFGASLMQHQLIQKMIAEMVVNIKAARLVCYQAGYLKDIGDSDSIMETWAAKYFASKMANKVASDAVQIHGACGCSSEYPVERYMRDAKIMEIIEGTSQMHEILIATNLFRHEEQLYNEVEIN